MTGTNAALPAGACDCHVHLYVPGHPLAPTATFQPPPATVDDYRAMQRALGLERVVLVQATGYGFDNTCLLDGLDRLGDAARGVVVVPASVDDAQLELLHARGVRGVRFMMLPRSGGLLPWQALPAMAERLAALDWTVNLQLDGRELPRHAPMLQRLPCKLVIDHTGKFLEPVTTDDPAFEALLELLDAPRRWVKLSAPYETSRRGAPHYEDVAALARVLLQRRPQSCLWASNWPHPNAAPRPSDAAMLQLLRNWAGDSDALLQQVLVRNPALAFDFAAG